MKRTRRLVVRSGIWGYLRNLATFYGKHVGGKGVLYQRHIASDDVCGCCGLESKTILHVLFKCTLAKKTCENFASIIDEGMEILLPPLQQGSFGWLVT